MTERAEGRANSIREELRHSESAPGTLRVYRCTEVRRDDAGSFCGLLYVHPELYDVEKCLRQRLRNRVASRRVPSQKRFAAFQRHCRDRSLASAFAGRDDVDVGGVQAEIRSAIVQQEPGALYGHSAAKSSVHAMRHADDVPPAVGNRE